MDTGLCDDGHTLPAQVRALLVPELLSQIFMWIYLDEDTYWDVFDEDGEKEHSYGRDGVLMRCGLVSKLWWEEAMPYLWADQPCGWSFVHTLRAVAPDRRRFLANCVKSVTMHTVIERDADEVDEFLRGLTFPKLHTLKLLLDICCVHIPRIDGHAIRHLVIDPRWEVNPTMYALDEDTMDIFLDNLATSFPDLEEVVFDDRAFAHPGALERFAQRLPRLVNFDHGNVFIGRRFM
ncbi:hypothetical protein AURDEDRAFT_184744 [Auricularia subglabra TFB-10046 SS5]|nr:hypothetical protein AURDEDRAFT_184744 [Auricularia subglabra TFB-10046 SS5]